MAEVLVNEARVEIVGLDKVTHYCRFTIEAIQINQYSKIYIEYFKLIK